MRVMAVVQSWTSPPVKMKRKGRPRGIGQQVVFGSQSSSGTPQSLVLGPPFPVAACWWARTRVVSNMDVFIVRILDQGGEHPLPDSGLGPNARSACGPIYICRTAPVGHASARRSAGPRGRHARTIGCRRRAVPDRQASQQKPGNPLPLPVRQFVPLDHRQNSRSNNLEPHESHLSGRVNHECRLDLIRHSMNCISSTTIRRT